MITTYTPLPTAHKMPSEWPDEPTVVTHPVPAEVQELLLSRVGRARVMVLPRATPPAFRDDTPERKPAYSDHDLLAVETLRRNGVDILALHDPAERYVSAEFSAEVVIALGLFIAQAIGEEEITNIYRYLKLQIGRVRGELAERGREDVNVALAVDVLRVVQRPNETEVTMKGVRGPAEPTLELVREVLKHLDAVEPPS